MCKASQWTHGERLVAELSLGLLSWAAAALVLSLAALMHWFLVLPLAAAIWAGVRRWLPGTSGSLDRWWILAILLALITLGLNSLFPSEHYFTARDGGTYLTTAGWLAQEGSLFVETGTEAFSDFDELEYGVPGFYQREGRDILEPQFMHAYPAMLGSLIDASSAGVGLRLNAAISAVLLLAVFGLARRFVRPVLALVASGALALSLPVVYYSRAPFSEPLMAVFVVAGVWLLVIADEEQDPKVGYLAGALIGGAALVRLDGLVLILSIAGFLAVRSLVGNDVAKTMRAARTSMFAVAALALGESLFVSPAYILERSGMVVPVLFAILLVIVVSDFLAGQLAAVMRAIDARKPEIFLAIVVIGGVLLTYAWLVRPEVAEVQGGAYSLAGLQEQEGLEVEAGRNYAEQSVKWITWYQGEAFVILCFVGLAVFLYRGLFISRCRRELVVGVVLTTFAVLYLWRPSINPDHIWVMRRYLTVVLPLGVVAAVQGVDWIVDRLPAQRNADWRRTIAGVTLSGLLLVQPLTTTLPVWNVSEFAGLGDDISNACRQLGSDAQVLVIGEIGATLTQTFRSHCGSSAAYTDEDIDHDTLEDLARSVESEGKHLVLVGVEEGTSLITGDYEFLELTLSFPPQSLEEVMIRINASELDMNRDD